MRRSKRALLMIETEQETDGRWIAAIPELPGVMVYEETLDEAIAAVKKLAESVIAGMLEHGESVFVK